MNQDIIVSTDMLTRRFGDIVAVHDLTFSVRRGEVFGLLGHNGAGKTTSVRLITGVLSPSAGSVRTLGMSPETDAAAIRRRTGVLTETPSLYETLTARDNLTIFANLYEVPSERVAAQVAAALETFGLTDRADEKVGGYSKGMKQRLALARAILHEPAILFLDEPTAGLDPVAARGVHDLIMHLSQEEGRTVFLCTHNLTEAQRLCDRVAIMEHGRLVALGTPHELSQRFAGALRWQVEIEPGQMAQAEQTLSSRDDISTAHTGNTLIITGAHHDIIPDLLAALVQAGVRFYRVEPDEASLEAVYFALHDQEGRSA